MTDYESDPIQFLKEQVDRLSVENQRLAAINVSKEVSQAEREMVRADPAYFESLAFLRQKYVAEQAKAGVSEAEALNRFQAEAWAGASRAIAQGVNPAEAAYRLAQESGFNPHGEPEDSARRIPEFDLKQLQREALPRPSGDHQFDKVFGR